MPGIIMKPISIIKYRLLYYMPLPAIYDTETGFRNRFQKGMHQWTHALFRPALCYFFPATNAVRSARRFEYPHSLSYQETALTMFSPMTIVDNASTVDEAGSPL